jgi:hypothetical protein
MFDIQEITNYLKSIEGFAAKTEEGNNALKRLQQIYGQLLTQQSRFGASLKDIGEQASLTKDKLTQVGSTNQQFQGTLRRVSQEITRLGGNVKTLELSHLSTEIGKFTEKLGPGADAITGFSKTLVSQLGSALNQNKALMWATTLGKNIVNPTKEWSPISSNRAFKDANDLMKDMLTTQAVARRSYIALGDSVGDANRKTSQYLMNLRTTQAALGMTKQEQLAFNQAAMIVPRVLDRASDSFLKTINMQGQMVQTSGVLQTALQRFRMTGAEAGQAVTNAFLQSGLSAEQFADFLGQANAALRGTDIDAKTALTQMLNANAVMGILGDQASRSTSLWHEFATTLRSSGVAADQVGKIVSSVTENITNMSTQNRAFIGMMSGMFQGATALGGALRMELAMRSPGGMEQNLEALTSTLARFGGGRIITLEQAANNPQLEMQFVLQRQMLQKLGVAGTAQQQNRILEVLQGVQRGGVSRMQGGRELRDVMNKGRNIQEQLVTSIERVEQTLQTGLVRTANAHLGNIDKALEGFNRALGIGRTAAAGDEPISRSGIGRVGRAMASQSAADFRQQLVAGFGLIGGEVRRTMVPGTGSRLAPLGLRGERLRGVRAEPGLNMNQNILRTFGSALRAFRNALTGQENRVQLRRENLRAARLPALPGMAAVPGTTGPAAQAIARGPSRLPALRSQQMSQTLQQVNRTATATRTAFPPGLEEILRGTTGGAAAAPATGGPATPAATVTATESIITVKIESGNQELRNTITKILKDTLAKEMKKYVSAER